MNKTQRFLKIFHKAKKKYSLSQKRLAAERWQKDWQSLIAIMLSAQTRDEVTIPAAERLFKNYKTLSSVAKAPIQKIRAQIKPVNYHKTKSKHVKQTSNLLLQKFNSSVPDNFSDLISLPGVGRKTANLFLSEIHNRQTITVDTHVHRISNALGLVKTKTPAQTETELKKISPKKYWRQINRTFVLWGKDVQGKNKHKLLKTID